MTIYYYPGDRWMSGFTANGWSPCAYTVYDPQLYTQVVNERIGDSTVELSDVEFRIGCAGLVQLALVLVAVGAIWVLWGTLWVILAAVYALWTCKTVSGIRAEVRQLEESLRTNSN